MDYLIYNILPLLEIIFIISSREEKPYNFHHSEALNKQINRDKRPIKVGASRVSVPYAAWEEGLVFGCVEPQQKHPLFGRTPKEILLYTEASLDRSVNKMNTRTDGYTSCMTGLVNHACVCVGTRKLAGNMYESRR